MEDQIVIEGVTWHKGENPAQDYYEANICGVYWVALRPKGVKPSYWAAMAIQHGATRCLNCATRLEDQQETQGPLYGIQDPPDGSPMKLLEGMTRLALQLDAKRGILDPVLQERVPFSGMPTGFVSTAMSCWTGAGK